MQTENWQRSDIIACLAIGVSLVSFLITLFVTEPHLRSLVGLDRYPRLHALYTGTETYGNKSGGGSFTMQLYVDSENPVGGIAGHIHLNRSYNPDCPFNGSVTLDNQIRITCVFTDHQLSFEGYMYPDHIGGTAVTNVPGDLYHIYQWNLVPKPGTNIL